MSEITKLQPKFSGKTHTLVQELDPERLEYLVVCFKYKDEELIRTSWTDIEYRDLLFALDCLKERVRVMLHEQEE